MASPRRLPPTCGRWARRYFAVEGRPPFSAASVAAVLVAVLTAAPPVPVLAGALAPVLAGLLVKDPAGRTPAQVLAGELAQVAAGGEVTRILPPEPPKEPDRRRGGRGAAAVFAALGGDVAAVALLAVALIWLPDQWRAQPGPDDSGSGTSSSAEPANAPPSAGPTATKAVTATVTVTPEEKRGGTHTITYKVGGTADSGDVTYSTPSGQEQHDIDVPWEMTFEAAEDDFDFPQLLASNKGGGTIVCEIYVDGVKVRSGKSTGEFKNVSCDGGM